MTATDELRRMLDERGVKYEVDDAKTVRVTRWRAYGDWVSFIEYDNGDTKFCIDARRLTPEQAIAATLGREPDDAAMVKLHDRMNVALLECERKLGIEKADGTIVVPFVFEMHNLLEEATALGSCSCTNSERTETCNADETETWECVCDQIGPILRDAADTIWELRDSVHRERAEADRLRERITTQKQTIQAYRDESREWREVADHVQAENAKLQELLDYMTPIAWYAASEREREHMRELGIEVDG